MLVLTRKKGDKIIIQFNDQQVDIMVTEIGKGQVKLGVNAQKEIKVFRSELVEGNNEKLQ